VPFISKKNLHVRKEWAEERLDWTLGNWRAVNFSDESIFYVFGSDGIEWCWRRPGEHLDPRFMKKKVKHGGGKVTVWGMITAKGVGRIVRIEGNLNKELYRDILEDNVLGTYRDLHMDPRRFYFQQDNDPKHTAKIVRAWFQGNDVDLLPWRGLYPPPPIPIGIRWSPMESDRTPIGLFWQRDLPGFWSYQTFFPQFLLKSR